MTHPHDVALLYDLVDGRLGERAAAELRQRIADEPALRATWDEIARLRASLRALPAAVPPGTASGIAPRERTRARKSSGGTAVAKGRLLSFRSLRPWIAGVAAVAVVVLSANLFLGTRDASTSRDVAHEDWGAGKKAVDDARRPEESRATGRGAPAPTLPPPTTGITPYAAGPTAGPTAPTLRNLTEASESERRGNDGPESGLALGGMTERDPADAPAGGGMLGAPHAGPSAPSGTAEGAKAKEATGAAPFAWARHETDEVLFLRAGSADEARAEVGLLLRALSASEALPAIDLARRFEPADRDKDRLADAAPAEAAAESDDTAKAPPPETARASPEAGSALAPEAFLTFRLELEDAQWGRLEEAVSDAERTAWRSRTRTTTGSGGDGVSRKVAPPDPDSPKGEPSSGDPSPGEPSASEPVAKGETPPPLPVPTTPAPEPTPAPPAPTPAAPATPAPAPGAGRGEANAPRGGAGGGEAAGKAPVREGHEGDAKRVRRVRIVVVPR
ncbi:MAG TPA: hypothetical protein VND21_01445 [Planctomycetota bacterium]|nr:hypothetical protein [Planctomycetota bacterium]